MGLIDFVSGGGATDVGPQYKYKDDEIDPSRQQEQDARGYQTYLAGKYQDQIEGKGPSVAQEQMKAQNATNKRQQLGMARSGGGGALGQAGAMRNAQQAASQQDAALAQSSGLVRAQEQSNAMAGLGAASGQLRGQDQSRMGAEMDYQNAQASAQNAYQSNKWQAEEAYKQRRGSGTGGLFSAGAALGGAALLSDERMKTGIEDLPPQDVEAFLEAAAGHRYKYREGSGEDPNRERVGVMAQDLEGTDVGSTFVDEGPDGTKRIDTGKGYGAMLAAMHEMHARIKELEGQKGGK